MFISYVVCCIGSGLCDGLITRPEEYVTVCDVELSAVRRPKAPNRAVAPENIKMSSSKKFLRLFTQTTQKGLYLRWHSQIFERQPSALSCLFVRKQGTTPLPVDGF
jgi:hypothetical protein